MRKLRAALLSLSAIVVGCNAPAGEEPPSLAQHPGTLEADTWLQVDIGGGDVPSLAVDPSGNPALSYRRGRLVPEDTLGDNTVVFASNNGSWRTGAGWSTQDIQVVIGNTDGLDSALAFNPSPQIAFLSRYRHDSAAPMALKFARRNSFGGWQVQTLAGSLNHWVYQVEHVTHGGATYVVYGSPTGTGIETAIQPSGSTTWTYGAVPSVPLQLLSSLSLASTSNGVGGATLGVATTTLSANGGRPQGLHFAQSQDSGATFSNEDVDSTGAMIGPRVVYAGSTPHIAYTDLDADRARYATLASDGKSWVTETIATFPGQNPPAAIALDANGQPVVALVVTSADQTASELYVGRRVAPGSWTLELADRVAHPEAISGTTARIGVAADGTVLLAYAYGQNQDMTIRFTWRSPKAKE